MSILVDPAIWPWRNDRWAHLISDVSEAELHEFAERLGVRRLSFQGDHYDVSVETRRRALALGAEEISSRELVSRLRASGLRHRDKVKPWTRHLSREDLADQRTEVLLDQLASAALCRAVSSAVTAPAERSVPLVLSLFVRDTTTVVLLEGLGDQAASAMTWTERHTTLSANGTWAVEFREDTAT